MLRLVYTSTHQRRLVELEQEFERLNDELDIALDEHNHDNLYFLSKSIYRFVASTGKYLHFQSSEGDLASFGNNSAFRRLYQSILTLQLTISEAIRTYGIKEKTNKNYEQISTRISGITGEMKKYHNSNDIKIDGLLDEILQLKLNIDNWNSELEEGKVTYKSRNEITDYLLEKVAERIPKDKWIRNTHKKIAEELGISNNLAEMCVDKIFKEGIITYNEKTDN